MVNPKKEGRETLSSRPTCGRLGWTGCWDGAGPGMGRVSKQCLSTPVETLANPLTTHLQQPTTLKMTMKKRTRTRTKTRMRTRTRRGFTVRLPTKYRMNQHGELVSMLVRTMLRGMPQLTTSCVCYRLCKFLVRGRCILSYRKGPFRYKTGWTNNKGKAMHKHGLQGLHGEVCEGSAGGSCGVSVRGRSVGRSVGSLWGGMSPRIQLQLTTRACLQRLDDGVENHTVRHN